MKIKAWKGGRTDRVYARITPQAKKRLLARIKLEGFTTIADWIESEAEAERSPTKRAADSKACEQTFHQLMKLQGKLFCCDCGVRL